MALDEQYELLEAIQADVEGLVADHEQRRKHWYFHELIPWERGESFKDKPWDESQCTLSENARTSLVLNLLTEDNLPWYHRGLALDLPEHPIWEKWLGIWTAEEGQHAIAIRTYLLASRNSDPRALENDRMDTMKAGWRGNFASPIELLAYTSAQELATRVAHRNAGDITDDKAALDLMRKISTDENHHFVFYRGVLSALLRENASAVLKEIHNSFVDFRMPGSGIPGFLRRSVNIARAGVYNLRIHHDRVLQPLLEYWNIGSLSGLTSEAAEFQEKIMGLPDRVLRSAERFEARFGTA